MNEEAPQPEVREVDEAAGAVHRAEEELQKAREWYGRVRRDAAEQLKEVRETTVGDLVEATLNGVRRRPAAGLFFAALAGFFLGRLFRR